MAKVKTKAAEKNLTEIVPDIGDFQIRTLKETEERIQIKVDNVRLTWIYLDKPQAGDNGANYCLTMLIPKTQENVAVLKKIAEKVCKTSTKFAKENRGEVFKKCVSGEAYSLFRDGDKRIQESTGEPYPGCARHLTLTAKMQAESVDGALQPKNEFPIVRADRSRIAKHELSREIYAGMYGSVICTISAYNTKGKVGLTCYLNGVQKLADGTKLSGSVADIFDNRSDLMSVGLDSNFDNGTGF